MAKPTTRKIKRNKKRFTTRKKHRFVWKPHRSQPPVLRYRKDSPRLRWHPDARQHARLECILHPEARVVVRNYGSYCPVCVEYPEEKREVQMHRTRPVRVQRLITIPDEEEET